MMTVIIGPPFLVLPRAPSTLNPPLGIKYFNVETWLLFALPYQNIWLRACIG